jgi:cytochrome c oxidase cbb3-type subunit 1
VTLPLGITTGKEYAELEWPIDLLIAVVWVAYAVVFFGTLATRKVKHIYVANWFFAAYIITIAVLHIVNSAEIPVTLTKSYSAYAGVTDAMVQWWYGHNAVGFFLTAAFLGMMYYFIPKQAGRPIYSYRLSIVHFWSLISIYMWAGPHHLHYTTLPDWVQTLGMVFSLMLLAPSWGGMINGIMTLSGAWHKLRTDPILKFLIVSLSFYGMSTFEGPMMSIKTVNALSHYTDWTIGHVHSGALGWVAMVSVGTMYALIPRLYGQTKMWSTRLIDWHFWTTTIGIVLYVASMWIAGVMQGLMWRATNADGTLTYTFVEALKATYPYYAVRLVGGTLVLAGMFLMAYNVAKTIGQRQRAPEGGPRAGLNHRYPRTSMKHEVVEKNIGPAGRPDRRGDQHRRPGRDRAAGGLERGDAAGAGREAVHRAAARGPRRLHPRGLLQLPLADDPAAARRDRALRPLLARGRVGLRPSVPVRLQAHRPGPRARRRPLLRRVASPHLMNPRDLVPESNMPGYPWLANGRDAIRPSRREDEGAAHGRRALHRRADRRRQPPRCRTAARWTR